MPCCSAVGCSNRSEKGFRLFKFPANNDRREVWITNCRRENWVPTKSSFLCENHFEPDQYEQHRADGRKLLKPFAVPTIFKHDFKPQKLKEQIDYMPNAVTNLNNEPTPAADHTYTVQNHKTTLTDQRLFNQTNESQQAIIQTELSYDVCRIIKTENLVSKEICMEELIASGNENITNVFQFWDVQEKLDFQPREDSFREILGESQTGKPEPEVAADNYVLPVPKNRSNGPSTTRLKARIKKLETKLKLLKSIRKGKRKQTTKGEVKKVDLNNLYGLAESGNFTAIFIRDQAMKLCLHSNKWSELTIKNCLYWRMRSPNGYDFVHKRRVLKLPSRYLLKSYIGFTKSENALPCSIIKLIRKDMALRDGIMLTAALFVDVININSCSEKAISFFLGQCERQNNNLTFLYVYMRDISSDFSFIVGFFPVTVLNEEIIFSLIYNKLVKELEREGVLIAQLVIPYSADNKSCIKEKINHPNNLKRFLYVKYDPNTIIQHIYKDFLTKDFITPTGCISSLYLNTLQEMQNGSHCKSEFFNQMSAVKVVKLEKIELKSPASLFSVELTNALNTLLCLDHPQFSQCGPTVEFIKAMSQWLNVQNELKPDNVDGNIDWLLHYMLEYIEEIEKCCLEKEVEFLNADLLKAFKFSTHSMALFLQEVGGME